MNGTIEWSILVVDDVESNVDILVGILDDDYDVSVAMDGEAALVAVDDDPPDLILLDIMMPGMDGYEVCRRLKANPTTEKIPVIFVTAKIDVADEIRGFELGAVDYITKPISSPIVQARVKTHLALYDQKRALESMVRQRTSELRNTLVQLQQEWDRFQWVIQQADDGYLILNADGKVIYTNPKARLYLDLPETSSVQGGLNQEDLPSETFVDLAKKQYRFKTKDAWAKMFSQSKERVPCYLVRPESAIAKDFWLQVDALEMAFGEGISWLIRVRDVTAQVGTQRDQRAFTSMIYHKMKTPLISMVSGWELLEMLHDQLSPQEITDTISGAVKGARRLQSTVEDILGYIDTPALAFSGERCRINGVQDILKDVCSGLEIDTASIVYSQDLSSASELILSRRAMELILWELIENAKKFHPKRNPKVEIAISQINPDEISLKIQDDGINVSPEHLSKFWTPYYQGEKDFTGQVTGMGLGSAMVSALVWRVGGTCRASNRADKPGVVIELVLPSS
ncbi:MAG: response regulator [Anaerolineales bacterium]|nr:response regulator [Anaerolineales bacterium]